MAEQSREGQLLARCIVCRGDIYGGERHEIWDGAYYCERHSLPYLRERAQQYAALLQRREVKDGSS